MIPGFSAVGNSDSGAAPFSPDDIAGLELWLDASDAATVTLSGSDVTTWANKGSLGGSLDTSGGLYDNPTYATAVQNGLNAIDTVVASGQALRITNQAVLKQVAGWTIFVVAKPSNNTPGAQYAILSIGGAGATTTRAHVGIAPTTGYWRTGGRRLDADTFVFVASTTQASTANVGLITAIGDYTNTDGTLRLDGAQIAQDTAWLTSGNTSNTNGQITFADNGAATSFYGGRTYEILVYNTVLSGGDITTVEAYLTSKWGL